MTQSYYDVVFIGRGLANLLCAALLAKRGFRVLVLGQGDAPSHYGAGDFELPREPFTLTASNSPAVRRVLAEIALGQAIFRRAHEFDPPFQIALPRNRFDMTQDAARFETEIQREFPEVQRSIEGFHRQVQVVSEALDDLLGRDITWPPKGFFDRREANRVPIPELPEDPLAELPEHHPFRTAVRAPICFASHADYDTLGALPSLRLYDSYRRGSLAFDASYGWFAAQLEGKIETYSGEIRNRDRCDRIIVRRGAVGGVRLELSGETIGCNFVIFGQDLRQLVRLVPRRSTFEETFERWGDPQVRHYRYAMHIVVRKRAIPPGLSRELFMVRAPRRRLAGDNLLRLVHAPFERDADHERISIEVLLSRRDVEDVSGYLTSIRERVRKALLDLLPFVERDVVLVDSPHDGRDIELPESRRLITPEDRSVRGPHTMPRIHTFPVWRAFGLCALEPETPIRNLLLCNTQVVPALGTEGLFLAAWSAARIVTKSDRRKARMRKGRWTKLEL